MVRWKKERVDLKCRSKNKERHSTPRSPLLFDNNDLFYPLYHGWTTEECPFFKFPTEALCWQLSRFLKDGICQSQSLSSLHWMRCIGWVRANETSHRPHDYTSASTREREYFSNVIFQYLVPKFRPGSIIMISHPDMFEQCKATFHSHSDYQLSSQSTYKKGCIQDMKGFSKLSQSDHKGMRIQRDADNLICIGHRIRSCLRNKLDFDLDLIVSSIKRMVTRSKDKSLIVSLCCGNAPSEINSIGSSTVLCLDTNRRSLFAARMSLLELDHPSSIFVSYYDYSSNIDILFSRLKAETGAASIRVLYQHPTPSQSSSQCFSLSCLKSSTALLAFHIDSIHIVFDHNPGGNTWNVKKLKAAFGKNLDSVSNTLLSISRTKRLCFIDGEKVHHPLFGIIKRYGWAKMKSGEELAIEITRKEH